MRYLLSALLLLCSTSVYAADLPREAEQLNSKLSGVRSYQADFSMETKEEDGKPVKLEGKILFKTPNLRKLEIKQDDTGGLPQVIVADGKLEWHYDPNSAQVLRSKIPADLPGPHRPFGEIQPGTLRFVQKNGSGRDSVSLFEGTPAPVLVESSPVPIKLIRLEVGDEDGFLRHLVLLDEKGQEVLAQRYSNIRINVDVPSSEFVFTPPDGVPVRDLTPPARND
jgi:outer membrane lipoprotein-sorting protein